jgi:hypothetical protein
MTSIQRDDQKEHLCEMGDDGDDIIESFPPLSLSSAAAHDITRTRGSHLGARELFDPKRVFRRIRTNLAPPFVDGWWSDDFVYRAPSTSKVM